MIVLPSELVVKVCKYPSARGICPPQPDMGSAIKAAGVIPFDIRSSIIFMASKAYALPEF